MFSVTICPSIQLDDTVGLFGVVGGVGDHDDGDPFDVQIFQQRHDLASVCRIEISGGFVGKDQRRMAHHSPCDGDTLLLTARELLRIMVHAVTHLHPGEDITDHFPPFAGTDPHDKPGATQHSERR